MLGHVDGAELGEAWLEVFQFEGIGPVVLIGSTEHLENLENLINLRVTHKKRPALNHLSKDASSGPKVNTQSICLLAEQNFGAAVPEGNDFMSVRFNWESKSAGKAKISQLNVLTCGVNKQVLGLQIAMENSVLVEMDEGLEDLIEESLGLLSGKGLAALSAHELFQVKL
jgi:hypothetical protein